MLRIELTACMSLYKQDYNGSIGLLLFLPHPGVGMSGMTVTGCICAGVCELDNKIGFIIICGILLTSEVSFHNHDVNFCFYHIMYE